MKKYYRNWKVESTLGAGGQGEVFAVRKMDRAQLSKAVHSQELLRIVGERERTGADDLQSTLEYRRI